MTSDAMSGDSLYANQYPDTVAITCPDEMAKLVGAYGAVYQVWIGPKGWTGGGGIGADGGAGVDLHPVGGSDTTGPRIGVTEVPACQACMLGGAAVYFPAAMSEYNQEFNQQGDVPVTKPNGLVITRLSKSLVTYTLPDERSLSVRGVAYFDSTQTADEPFIDARFVFEPRDSLLATFLVRTFIKQKGLR
jgi:hypothetical protein